MEASALQVVGSFPSGVVERVQQHTVEQIVHVLTPQIQDQIEESVQVVDLQVPPIAEEVAEELSSSHAAAHAAPNIDTAPASVSLCATPSLAAIPLARACNRGKGADLYHQHGSNGAIKSPYREVIGELNKRTMQQCALAG